MTARLEDRQPTAQVADPSADAAEHGPTPLDEALILAAGARDADLRTLISTRGARACADVLAAEIVSRYAAPELTAPVAVALVLADGAERFVYRMLLSPQGLLLGDPDGPASARIEADLAETARSLFGPAGYDAPGLRAVHLDPDALDPAAVAPPRTVQYAPGDLRRREQPHPVVLAAQAVAAACGSAPADLGDLAVRCGTDKWGAWHWYTRDYDRHFAVLRDQPVRVLEIGIGGYADPAAGGGSLRMWKRYFRRGIVVGIDLFDKPGVAEPRIRTLSGSQDDPDFLARVAAEYGPFDVVIDDGSHLNAHVLASFTALFPHVRPGGYYVIEDHQTAYWPQYGGSPGPEAGPGTSVGLLKALIDGLDHQESAHPRGYQPSYTDLNVTGLHCYHNLAFVQKGRNTDATLPAWIRRAPVKSFYREPGAAAGPVEDRPGAARGAR